MKLYAILLTINNVQPKVVADLQRFIRQSCNKSNITARFVSIHIAYSENIGYMHGVQIA